LIAGGQSLGPMLNLRLARPAMLIDLSRASDLRECAEYKDSIRIGAAVTHAEIEDGRTPAGGDGFMAKAARSIAYRAVRNRGTIGGSLAHADPAGDWPLVLSALGASLDIKGSNTCRETPVERFFKSAFATELNESEMIVAITVPRSALNDRWGYWKLCRKAGEFPIASAAVLASGKEWRIFLGALSDKPRRMVSLGKVLGAGERVELTPSALMPFIAETVPGIDEIDRRMYAGCLSRALMQAVYS
jgi:carbon-monoxide dehydrogenase medium subunit